MAKSKPVNLYFRLEALAWKAFLGGLGALSVERASRWGAGVLPLVGPLTSANKTALRNLRLAFPNETETWRESVRKECWREVGRMAGEFPHLGKFVERLDRGEIAFEGREKIEAARGAAAVYIGGHFSNWEVSGLCLAQADPDCNFTYRPANNPIIDQDIVDQRAAYGLKLQAPKGKQGGMGLLRTLARKHSVAVLNDQKYNHGVAAPLFGHDCMTADGPTRLALKFKAPMIPVLAKRISGVKFEVKVYDPIPLNYDNPDDPESVREGVFRVNEFMEARIREAPEQWFWVHRRWPKEAWKEAGVM